jgi:hypothetical protein
MTPADEAHELYDKFIFPCWECDEFDRAKQCAIITVDKLIKETGSKYWYDVKHELEKL